MTDAIPPQQYKPEFSRPFNTERLQLDPRDEKITANAEECIALAKRFGVQTVESLAATVRLQRLPNAPAVISIEGRVRGKVVQSCVVTLEPVPESIDEEFETLVAPPAYVEKWLREHPEDDLDAPEALDHGHVDLGEVAAQYFALALNPYPRKEGLEFIGTEQVPGEEKQTPFAVLALLKEKK